ncbi:MAG: glyoxalase [Acidobacteria bacterium]|nr:MAG: glyoxalase [Acidobacteriota bacterium]
MPQSAIQFFLQLRCEFRVRPFVFDERTKRGFVPLRRMPPRKSCPPEIKSRIMLTVLRTYAKRATFTFGAGLLLLLAALPSIAQDQPARPPITGITYVRLWSTDLPKSVAFYRKILGLTPRDAGCAGLMRPCFIINEHQQIALAKAASDPPANFLAEIAFATTDAAGMRRYLMAHNVAAVSTITRDINGTAHFSLLDPEGHPIAFVQAPAHRQFSAPAEQVSTRLIHAGFVVKDMAAENRFYLDLLGFRLYWHGGFKDNGLDWYEIQVPDGDSWIEYMLNIPPGADHKELGVQNHFSLGVKDIHAAADQLHKNGLQKFDGPEIGRDGKWGLDAYDPDGTRVEVMEFTPAKEPCCHPYTAPHPNQ